MKLARYTLVMILLAVCALQSQTHTFPATDTNNTFTGANTFTQNIIGNLTGNATTATTATTSTTATTANNSLLLLGSTWAVPPAIGSTTPNAATFTTVNNVLQATAYAGTDACVKMSTAMTALPATGGVVDARGFQQSAQTCSINPFAANPTKPVQLIFCGTITTLAPWVLEESQMVSGCGRDVAILKADPAFDFAANKAVAIIGSTAAVNGSRYENMRVDCVNDANGVGFYSQWAQEQSGLEHIAAIRCSAKGIWWEHNSANNSYMRDVEVLNTSGNASANVPLLIDDVKGFRGIDGITVNNNGTSTNPALCIKLDNATTGVFNGIHMEFCGNGIDVGASTGVQGVVVSQVFPSNTITTVIKINGPDTPANSIVFQGINRGSATNTVNDVENNVLVLDALVPSYVAAAGQTAYTAGASIQSTVTTGTAPFVVASTTPVANLAVGPTTYTHAGTQLTGTHVVADVCTLGTSCSVTLTGSAVFTSSSSYQCAATDQTAAAAVKFLPSSGSAFALTGTGTDVLSYHCVGN